MANGVASYFSPTIGYLNRLNTTRWGGPRCTISKYSALDKWNTTDAHEDRTAHESLDMQVKVITRATFYGHAQFMYKYKN